MSPFLPSIAATLVVAAPSVVPADLDDPSDASTEEQTVLVVGQRDAPMTVVPRGLAVSLGAEQFDAVNALNVEDLMKYAPNFFVRKRFAGDDNAVVALRGANTVQSARTIVLVDGFLVSNFLGNR
jgi:iron complex outermembrane receptor protein